MSQRIAFLVVLLGAVLWGTTGTAQTYMPQTVHPLAVGASRLAVGGFTLLIIMLVLRKIDFRNWPWKATIFIGIGDGDLPILLFHVNPFDWDCYRDRRNDRKRTDVFRDHRMADTEEAPDENMADCNIPRHCRLRIIVFE